MKPEEDTMSMTDHLVTALKQHMRARNLTYKDAAAALDLSEASVKRLFSEKNFTMRRLEILCDLVEISLSELLEAAEHQILKTDQLSREQEQAIVENPKLLLVGVCIINGYSFAEILAKYRLDEPELIGLFTRLDRLNIIELLPGNRYRLKLSPDFNWQPNGPIQRFFIESLVKEYLVGEMKSSDHHMHLVWGMLSPESGVELEQKIRRLIDDYVHLTSRESKLPMAAKYNSSLFVVFKENWEPSVFKAQWQEKHGLK
jgi:DNA-binding Xre family transcriptional regulator